MEIGLLVSIGLKSFRTTIKNSTAFRVTATVNVVPIQYAVLGPY